MLRKEDILRLTNRGLDIFRFYLPIDLVVGKNFCNPLYNDKHASCNVFYDNRKQCYRMKDFGDDNYSGDCFWFASKVMNLDVRNDFGNVLNNIERDLHLGESETSGVSDKRMMPVFPAQAPHHNESVPRKYRWEEKPFSDEELSFWGKYGITEAVLLRYNVKSVRLYESVNRQNKPFSIRSTRQEPMFAYLVDDCIKIYRPQSRFRFLYGGKKSDTYIFGYDQLPRKGSVLFITGGEKDVLSLASHGFHAICFNSETFAIPTLVVESLTSRFRHIVLLFDADKTGVDSANQQKKALSAYNVLSLTLPLKGTKSEKDISDYFALGYTASDLRNLLMKHLFSEFKQTVAVFERCKISSINPPDKADVIVSCNGVPLGCQGGLLCVTGCEGSGKSNFISALLAGTFVSEQLDDKQTLGFSVAPNPKGLAVLHYDTEQSEADIHSMLCRTLKRSSSEVEPPYYASLYLSCLSRKDRLQLIRESLDLMYYKHGGVHLVVIDGVADLISSVNDEGGSTFILDELYQIAAIYNTCVVCVIHLSSNGLKLRGHLGSEFQRKASGIVSVERDDNPEFSVVKALKVRNGSPLDVPMVLFGWDKEKNMAVYRGVKSKDDHDKRKKNDLIAVVNSIWEDSCLKKSYKDVCDLLVQEMAVTPSMAKKYVLYMLKEKILERDVESNYQRGELCIAKEVL